MTDDPPQPPKGPKDEQGSKPAPAGSSRPADHESRMVSHRADSVADALPTADEGDALFDELFGNVFDGEDDLGDATEIANAGIAGSLDDMDDGLPPPPVLDDPLAEPTPERKAPAMAACSTTGRE